MKPDLDEKSGICIWQALRRPSMSLRLSSPSESFQMWHVPRDDTEHNNDESIEKLIE